MLRIRQALAPCIAGPVVDLVETGTTMKAADLRWWRRSWTESVLIHGKNSSTGDYVIKKRILGYMTATSHVMITYNVAKVNLDKVLTITGKGPSVSPLLMNDKAAAKRSGWP